MMIETNARRHARTHALTRSRGWCLYLEKRDVCERTHTEKRRRMITNRKAQGIHCVNRWSIACILHAVHRCIPTRSFSRTRLRRYGRPRERSPGADCATSPVPSAATGLSASAIWRDSPLSTGDCNPQSCNVETLAPLASTFLTRRPPMCFVTCAGSQLFVEPSETWESEVRKHLISISRPSFMHLSTRAGIGMCIRIRMRACEFCARRSISSCGCFGFSASRHPRTLYSHSCICTGMRALSQRALTQQQRSLMQTKLNVTKRSAWRLSTWRPVCLCVQAPTAMRMRAREEM